MSEHSSMRIQTICIAGLSLSFATAAAAQGTVSIDGDYELDRSSIDQLNAGLKQVADSMSSSSNDALMGFLRSRHPAYAKVKISTASDAYTVVLDQNNPMRMPTDGATASWTRDDGKALEIKCQCSSTKIVQSI